MMICTKCGHQNEDGDAFCGSCGTFLEWAGERVAATEPEPALAGAAVSGGGSAPPPLASGAGADEAAAAEEEAKQTAEAFYRACNPFAEFSATRDLQPDDKPEWIRDRLRGETKDVLIAGHFYHLPRLRALLSGGSEDDFPKHGAVALTSDDDGATWREAWRIT